MRRIPTISFLLLVGVLATGTASSNPTFDSRNLPNPSLDLNNLPPPPKPFVFEDFPNALPSFEIKDIPTPPPFDFSKLDRSTFDVNTLSQSRDDDLVQTIKTRCFEKTDSDQLFDDLSASLETAFQCVLPKVDLEGFMDDLDNLTSSTRREFVHKYCSKFSEAIPCLDGPMELLSQCLDSDRLPMLQGLYHAIPQALDLICKNDGEILYDSANCMENFNSIDEWDECTGADSMPYSERMTYSIRLHRFVEGEDLCKKMTSTRNCVQGKIHEHECNNGLMELYDLFYNAVYDNSPCKNNISLATFWLVLGISCMLVCGLVWCLPKCRRRKVIQGSHFIGIIVTEGKSESMAKLCADEK